MLLEWTPVSESTNFWECLTLQLVHCGFGRINWRSVAALLSGTATRCSILFSKSKIPKTQTSLVNRPWLYFRFATRDSSISTRTPYPPNVCGGISVNQFEQTSRKTGGAVQLPAGLMIFVSEAPKCANIIKCSDVKCDPSSQERTLSVHKNSRRFSGVLMYSISWVRLLVEALHFEIRVG